MDEKEQWIKDYQAKNEWRRTLAPPCDACNRDAEYVRFHPKYPTHTYTLCTEHDNDETVNRLVTEYERGLHA